MSNGNNIAPAGSFTAHFVKARSAHTGRPTSETTVALPAGTDPEAYAAERGWELVRADNAPSAADTLGALAAAFGGGK